MIDVIVPASTNLMWTLGDGATGQNGAASGGATIANGVHYAASIVAAGAQYVYLRHTFGVAPTAGEYEITITRSRI